MASPLTLALNGDEWSAQSLSYFSLGMQPIYLVDLRAYILAAHKIKNKYTAYSCVTIQKQHLV
jgi:hypothetical protein